MSTRITARDASTEATAYPDEPNHFGAEASDLRLFPGLYPDMVYLSFDNGVTVALDRKITDEDGAEYHGRNGVDVVSIWAD